MRKITVLVVDDEPLMREELCSHLTAYPEIEVLAHCQTGEEALSSTAELYPDVIFLDIQMPGLSGMEVASVLSRQQFAPKVVFITAHDEHALKAFTVDALDYVLKPFDEDDIHRVVAKINKTVSPREQVSMPEAEKSHAPSRGEYIRKFCVQSGGKMEVIGQEQIQQFYAKERLVFLQTVDGASHLARFTLNELSGKLDPKLFIRCHRNHIVNLEQIKSLEPWYNRGYMMTLKGGARTEIPVSRQYVRDLKAHMDF